MTVRRTHALFTAAIAGALGLLSFGAVARAEITGSIKLEGKPPESKEIDMSGVKECKDQHADPVYEESAVVGEKGELANGANPVP